MKSVARFFGLIAPPLIIASAISGVIDLVRLSLTGEPSPMAAAFLETYVLAASLPTAAGLILALLFSTGLAATRYATNRVLGADHEELEHCQKFFRLGVAPSGSGWRMVAATSAIVVIALMATLTARTVTSLTNFTNVVLVVAHSIWVTAGAVVPAAVFRLVALRKPRWAPHGPTLWLFLSGWAYYVTVVYWMGASQTTLWAALPLFITPLAAFLFTIRERVGRAVQFGALATMIAAALVLVSYPQRWLAHAQISSGPIVASASWQILQYMTDLDGDGATHLVGGFDCGPLDYEVRPTAVEVPGDGIDNNCFGGDLAPKSVRLPGEEVTPTWGMASKPPVIILTIDTLRRDGLGRIVDGRPVSPYLDALLDGATHFANGYSTAAGTDESIPALMSGMYPSDWHQHGLYLGVERTLAEILGTVGYQTQAVILMPWLRSALIHGFEYIDNSLGERQFREEGWLSSSAITDLALERWDSMDPARPKMLWVHYYDVHEPRQTHVPDDAWLGGDAYSQRVAIVDREVGRFLGGLDERGVLDKAVIVVASDHGEGLGEHGLGTHGWGVWESVIRIPLAIRLPGIPPRRIEQPVSLVDVVPTLLDYFRVQDGVVRDGRSMLPAALGRDSTPEPIFIEAAVKKRLTFLGVIDENLKFFVDLRKGAYHLYDVGEDPLESKNLIESRPEDAKRLFDTLGRWRDGVFNEERISRKRELWERRSEWAPKEFVTTPRSLEDADDAL